MRQHYTLIALAAFAALALGVGCLLGYGAPANVPRVAAVTDPANHSRDTRVGSGAPTRHDSPVAAHVLAGATPLPPPGTPLKQEMAELQARADAGEAEAASRLFHDAQTCYEVRKVKTSTAEFARWALDKKPDGTTPEALQHTDRMLESIQKQLDYERDNAALCDGLSDAEVDNVLPRELRAAQLGDMLAAECYLGTRLSDVQGLLDHPEWLVAYKQNAPALLQAGLAQGDWGVVLQLSQALRPGPFGSASLLHQLIGNDLVQYYRYLKLISLGTTPGDPKQDEAHRQQLAEAADNLDANALHDADMWAQDVYQRNFGEMPQFSAENNPFKACHPGMQVEFR